MDDQKTMNSYDALPTSDKAIYDYVKKMKDSNININKI